MTTYIWTRQTEISAYICQLYSNFAGLQVLLIFANSAVLMFPRFGNL